MTEQSSTNFENTVAFIYKQTSKRINLKKEKLGLSNYQIAGFKNQKEYNEAPNYSKIDENILSMIINNKRDTEKKNKYLIPSKNAEMYYQAFINNLKFASIHEILWGNSSEIKTYLPQVFQNIMLDGLECNNAQVKNICSDLMNSHSEKNTETKISQIYEEIKEPFLKEFLDFTKAKISKEPLRNAQGVEYKIVDSKGSTPIIDEIKAKKILGTKINEYLGYQKLNKSLENFVENRLIPLFMGNIIEQFNH
ncbi:hypothetical protein [Enterococcus sp. DIV1420a]|uniref:hypothetical protein n=1 Tax=Enterococcus sp. DIV1420a TaxID=2774672 RepID=UPI003F1E8503